MNNRRQDLISILNEAFHDNELQQRCLDACKNITRHDVATRAFDHFPCLVSKAVLKDLTKDFVTILTNIKSVNKTDNAYELTKTNDKVALEKWQKKLLCLVTLS